MHDGARIDSQNMDILELVTKMVRPYALQKGNYAKNAKRGGYPILKWL